MTSRWPVAPRLTGLDNENRFDLKKYLLEYMSEHDEAIRAGLEKLETMPGCRTSAPVPCCNSSPSPSWPWTSLSRVTTMSCAGTPATWGRLLGNGTSFRWTCLKPRQAIKVAERSHQLSGTVRRRNLLRVGLGGGERKPGLGWKCKCVGRRIRMYAHRKEITIPAGTGRTVNTQQSLYNSYLQLRPC